MQNDVQKLEGFINDNYKSKASFAKALRMTPQNLNHHIRAAKKNGNKFSHDFIIKLEHYGIVDFEIPRNPTADFMSGPGEPDRFWEIIEAQRQIISSQREQIEALKEQLKPPLEMGKTGGRNT